MRWNYKDIVRWAVSRANVGAGEQSVLPPKGDRPDGAFNRVRVQFQTAIVNKERQSIPMLQRITDRLSQCRSAGDAIELFIQPRMHGLDQRPAVLFTRDLTLFGGLSTQIGLDLVQRRDPPQRFLGQRRLCRHLNIVELSPCMSPAEGELRVGVFRGDEACEPRVAIDLKQAAEPFQVRRRMLALAVFAVDISGDGMARTTPRPVVGRVAPEPSGFRSAPTWVQYRQGRVIGEHPGRGQHGAQHQFVQRREPPAGASHPLAQGGTIQHHTLTGEDLGLAIQRDVIAVFVDQNVRQQRFRCHAAVDRPIRRGCLNDSALTGATSEARTADQLHAQLRRHVIEHLGAVFPDDVHRAAATGARLVVDIDDDLDPGQVRRQRAAVALRRFGAGHARPGIRRRRAAGR